jgi:hypothetical protein
MRFITQPNVIIIKDLNTDKYLSYENEETGELEPVIASFYHFLVGSILKSAVFGKNAMTIMHAIDIKDKAANTKEDDVFEIEDEAYELLREAFKNDLPVVFDPSVALQFKPFFDCILNATTTKPEIRVEKSAASEKKTKVSKKKIVKNS